MQAAILHMPQSGWCPCISTRAPGLLHILNTMLHNRTRKRAREEDLQLRFPLKLSSFCPVWCSGWDEKHNTEFCGAAAKRLCVPKVPLAVPHSSPAPHLLQPPAAAAVVVEPGLIQVCWELMMEMKDDVESALLNQQFEQLSSDMPGKLETLRNAEIQLVGRIHGFESTVLTWYSAIGGLLETMSEWMELGDRHRALGTLLMQLRSDLVGSSAGSQSSDAPQSPHGSNTSSSIEPSLLGDDRDFGPFRVNRVSSGVLGDGSDFGTSQVSPSSAADASSDSLQGLFRAIRELADRGLTYCNDAFQPFTGATITADNAQDLKRGLETMLVCMAELQGCLLVLLDRLQAVNHLYSLAVDFMDNAEGDAGSLATDSAMQDALRGVMDMHRAMAWIRSGRFALLPVAASGGTGLAGVCVNYIAQMDDWFRKRSNPGAGISAKEALETLQDMQVALRQLVAKEKEMQVGAGEMVTSAREWMGMVRATLETFKGMSGYADEDWELRFVHESIQGLDMWAGGLERALEGDVCYIVGLDIRYAEECMDFIERRLRGIMGNSSDCTEVLRQVLTDGIVPMGESMEKTVQVFAIFASEMANLSNLVREGLRVVEKCSEDGDGSDALIQARELLREGRRVAGMGRRRAGYVARWTSV